VAFAGSVEQRVFIWDRTSRSCAGGRVFKVREIASGQVNPGGRSMPRGRGGRLEGLGGAPARGGGTAKPPLERECFAAC